MKFYGKAESTVKAIVSMFKEPENLPRALVPVFIHRKDDVPCRRWSWSNQLLTAIAGTQDARGFRQWGQVDRHVKKGSRAFHILAPCVKEIENERTGEKERHVFGFRSVPVFRLEDTEGEAIPVDQEAENWIKSLPLLAVAESWGLAVTTYNGEGGRCLGKYSPASHVIALGVENLSTWAHELIHAADDRCGNLTLTGSRALDETVAEMGGAVLLSCLGLEDDSDLGGAFAYIESWAGKAGRSVESACISTLNRICSAVALVLEEAEKHSEGGVAVAA